MITFQRCLVLLAVLTAGGPPLVPVVSAQILKQELEMIRHREYTADKPLSCFPEENGIVTQEGFNKLMSGEKCRDVLIPHNLDFRKQTLIAYTYRADCRVNGSAEVLADDQNKKFVLRISLSTRCCGTGGSIYRWIVIDKIPNGYELQFEETKWAINGCGAWATTFTLDGVEFPGDVQVKPIDTADCLLIPKEGRLVLNSRSELESAIRDNAGRALCLDRFRDLTLIQNTLIGVSVTSGYCGYPRGLAYELSKREFDNKYGLTVTYTDPEGLVCRTLRHYDLWLLSPKLDQDRELIIEVRPVRPRT